MSEPAPADAFDVVVVGSLNLDLVVRAPRLPGPGETVSSSGYQEFPGGKGLNQAVAAARAGASVAFVGAIGDDDAGGRLRHVVRDEGIDERWLVTVAGVPTGRALIAVDDHAENSIVVVPGANGRVRWPDEAPPVGAVVLAQLEVPLDTVDAAFIAARTVGSTTILNPAPAADLPDSTIRSSSLIVPNEHEAAVLGGVGLLLASGVGTIVTTLGARGARIDSDGQSATLPPFRVVPVDTTGAGDAFCGYLAARLAAGDDLPTGVRWAGAAGALATTIAGAVPSLPRSDAVQALLDAM
ncbi:ribokinase [bacterium]|nr:ribokinase [bacterium]